MPRIVHINCPRCGGTLGMPGADRVVKCRYCKTRSLVQTPDHVPEYWVRPKVDASSARRSVQRLLKDPEMPEGLLKLAQFHSARLYFIPYYEMFGRRTGTMMLKTENRPVVRQYSARQYQQSIYDDSSVPGRTDWTKPAVVDVDTRVVLNDLTRVEPAVRLDEWALEEAEISGLRSQPAGTLQPLDRRAMEKMGRIYNATVMPDQVRAQMEMRAETKFLEDNTTFGEFRTKRIYYPIWRVRYQYQGRMYGATIDGVTGKVMAARAPRDDRSRIIWMIGMSALATLIPGTIARVMLNSWLNSSSLGLGFDFFSLRVVLMGFFALLIVLAFMLLIIAIGWDQFRYPGELIIKGGERDYEKVGRPDETLPERMLFGVMDIFDASTKNVHKARWLFWR